MQNDSNQSKVRMFYQMLFEMATGNFGYRIPSYGEDQIDALAEILNDVAQQMQNSIQESGFVKPFFRYQNLSQATFILDSKSRIRSFSTNLSTVLGYRNGELYHKNFTDILFEDSVDLWWELQQGPLRETELHLTVQLIYRTAHAQLLPCFCTISKLVYSDNIIISFVATILQDSISDLPNITPAAALKSEAAVMQEVYEYILQHLETQLPGTGEISRHFGINEFRLKSGFRHFFKTSIHQFYNEERLKKAHLLIQQTNIPIKAIALMCGFTEYSNFYKAFKKRFIYAPSQLVRITETDTSL